MPQIVKPYGDIQGKYRKHIKAKEKKALMEIKAKEKKALMEK